ncbi:chromate transporter [Alkalihalobacillus oceani]|uniref:Chromate transporter n=1 Tax=Halalkalibacter oceani TaxID=1653776 RepID=A0A9X2DUI3_9BACI|nr:chromate transporter [Halalkalibacter oceani]MCM3716643.1 chromate transporter [Halalkalibacter oceani]
MHGSWSLIGQIFWSFFKIAPVTFGGGFAIISFIQDEVVERKKWIEPEEIADIFALAQSVPGAVAINSAIFIGHRVAGLRGAAAAMFGILIPTFLIIIGLCFVFVGVVDNQFAESAFTGIRAAIVALIAYAAIQVSKTAILDKTTFFLMVIMVLVLLFTHIHPIMIILSGGLIGIGLASLKQKMGLTVNLEKVEKDKEQIKERENHVG